MHERVLSRRGLPNLPCVKKKAFKEEQHFRRAAFLSAALLSRSSQQLFSAAFLSSSSQQLFSAAFPSSLSQQPFLSSFSQQPFSAAFVSNLSQQLFSAAFLSSLSQQPFSAALLSSISQQLFSAAFLSSSLQQPCSAAFLSSLSQQLFSAAFLSSFLSYHLAVVRGWWSATNTFFERTLSQPFRENTHFCNRGLQLSFTSTFSWGGQGVLQSYLLMSMWLFFFEDPGLRDADEEKGT